jgi:hypothetical protein
MSLLPGLRTCWHISEFCPIVRCVTVHCVDHSRNRTRCRVGCEEEVVRASPNVLRPDGHANHRLGFVLTCTTAHVVLERVACHFVVRRVIRVGVVIDQVHGDEIGERGNASIPIRDGDVAGEDIVVTDEETGIVGLCTERHLRRIFAILVDDHFVSGRRQCGRRRLGEETAASIGDSIRGCVRRLPLGDDEDKLALQRVNVWPTHWTGNDITQRCCIRIGCQEVGRVKDRGTEIQVQHVVQIRRALSAAVQIIFEVHEHRHELPSSEDSEDSEEDEKDESPRAPRAPRGPRGPGAPRAPRAPRAPLASRRAVSTSRWSVRPRHVVLPSQWATMKPGTFEFADGLSLDVVTFPGLSSLELRFPGDVPSDAVAAPSSPAASRRILLSVRSVIRVLFCDIQSNANRFVRCLTGVDSVVSSPLEPRQTYLTASDSIRTIVSASAQA